MIVYGGEIVLTKKASGYGVKLRVTHGIYTLGTKTAYITTGSGHNYTTNNPSDIFNSGSRVADVISEVLPSSTAGLGDYFTIYHQGTSCVVGVPDNYPLTDYNSEIAGTKIIYPLATPIEIDLTDASDIVALVGVNNVWSDTGDMEVRFKVGIQEYIDAKVSNNRSLSLSMSAPADDLRREEPEER